MHYLDTRTIKGIHYTVKVGNQIYEFESARNALDFANTARYTCSTLTWDDNPVEITIELFPIIEEEEEDPEEDIEVELEPRCDEKLEEECEA